VRDNPGQSFPLHHALDTTGAAAVRERVAARLGTTGGGGTEDEFLIKLRDLSNPVAGFDAAADSFDLARLRDVLRLEPSESLVLVWDRDSPPDRMATADVVRYLDELWYAAGDNVLGLVADTGDWAVPLTHWGEVRVARPVSHEARE